ncbi:DUF2239 family protein [Variovorax sp. YR216]|uniref:DUF2239 family protein n=1 Tax=Variovorax sp. YR216 TaxID=1882828 RepID=UPI0008988E99|nr:DUF2239 family protein [Variovorax sp. YR216]SEA03477.1 hypothetical protein SAMN05444680_101272 [Variovorax sp. YR216]
MSSSPESHLTAFAGFRRIASGPRAKVIAQVRKQCAGSGQVQPFVFDDSTGERLDIDLREGAPTPAVAIDEPSARGVGRPRLGVVAREVTLLPRHWEWLGRQPGGASVALRRLIDEARHVHADRDAQRAAREATYSFMTVIAGDLSGFEEAARALFAGDRTRFDAHIATWPEDVQAHLHKLATAAWSAAA